ncbi:MAG TPA: SusC/RagA family TonB-linked outer membrane protein [Gemmatimonadaceae bacterium]|nr:SusC/RagA family TonB-linked outer membrane protein [Gemmatimonadaceae bacterium]
MTTRTTLHRARVVAASLLSLWLAVPVASAQAQAAVITGKVMSEFGQAVDQANVYINDLSISVGTNAQGMYTITIPAARVQGQAINLRVRAIGFQPGVIPIRVTAGTQTQNFTLKQDVNRLNEVVVTGSIEATERAKVPFAIGRVTSEELPVPQLDPMTSLEGKVAGVRIASTSGQPGSTPDIMLRGPTSLNLSGRSGNPLIVVDGVVMNVGNLGELGGLDIESIEVIKGAAGASLYGTTAANGVITIKTKRGANSDGIQFNAREEYGVSDLNSARYGQPVNHHLQLDETGKRFCISGISTQSPCSKTVDFMTEIMRINNVNADTNRTPQNFQWNALNNTDGSLENVFQANIWPGRYYNTLAQVSTSAPTQLTSVDATGKIGTVRFFASGQYTDNRGALKNLQGDIQNRARVNLDYDIRSNLLVSLSTVYDKETIDQRATDFGLFGSLLRGAPAGTNYLAVDTLGRPILQGGGSGIRGTGNGASAFLYPFSASTDQLVAGRYIGSLTATFFPADWVTFDGTFAYDKRSRYNNFDEAKGFRTIGISSSQNFGQMSISNLNTEAMNGSYGALLRKNLTNDLTGRLTVRGQFDQTRSLSQSGSGQQFVVKDVFTLSNTSTQQTATSSGSLIKDVGFVTGGQLDYKGKYIVDGTYRYDGSSLFGAGNRWAPFGRVSAVWRVSEESFWKVPHITDFRLRASHGTAGNTPSFNAQYETYNCSTSGCSLQQAGNRNLKPETTAETELGTDFTLFNRLGIELTKADSKTKNQILNVPTPSNLGFTNQWKNAGTLDNHTWELAANLPVITKRDFSWNMKGTWDRTRSYISELFVPEYFESGGTGQGTGNFFLITARKDIQDGVQVNQYGGIWGRKFYKTCSDMPASVQSQCGDGKAYQVNDQGWVVWVGDGNSWKDGITKNLWDTKLPAAQSPWNYPLYFGHPIVDRPLRGQPGEGTGNSHILGSAFPSFRFTWNNTLTYKRLTFYGLLDGTVGNHINNQGEGWGLLDFASNYFDQGSKTVETAKPVGYGWRVGGAEGAGDGGFYDLLGPNNYNTENGSYAKIRELSITYRLGRVRGLGGDWTLGVIGRNVFTFTKYSGYDPEVGVDGGNAGSGLINQVDAFGYPTLRTYTVSLSTRF